MDILLHLILIIVPSVAIIYTVYLFLKKQSEKDLIHLKLELKKERQNFFLPSRLEAYQRAVLLLERVHPNSLVMRLHNPSLPAKMFQSELLKSIREEYDHNVAQQIFISPRGWELVKNSKEETIKIINLAGSQISDTATGTELAGKIFELVAEIGKLPNEIAVEYLKKELQELF
jgi:hypothetical protein